MPVFRPQEGASSGQKHYSGSCRYLLASFLLP